MAANILQATSLLPQILAVTQLTGGGDDEIYTVTTGQSVIVKTGVLCNITNDGALAPDGPATALVTIAVVPVDGIINGTQRVLSQFALEPGDSLSLDSYLAGANLGPGDSIHAESDTPEAVNIVLTGVVSS